MAAPNATYTTDHYVPILKCKQGELGALATAAHDRLVPLVELIDTDKSTRALAKAWGAASDAVLVQFLNLSEEEDAAWAAEVEQAFAELRTAGVCAVPVATTFDGPDLIAALRRVIAADGRGVAFRLDAEEELALATPSAVKGEVDTLLTDLAVAAADVDLIIDVGLLRSSIVARVTTAEAAMSVIPYGTDWRNLVTAFSGFPDALGDVAAKSAVTPINRDDAVAYATLIGRGPEREPLFGDYAVGVPFYSDLPWTPIPAIRYATGTTWMIHRGATKADRSAQYVALAGDVASAAYYSGTTFSVGDQYYSDVASGRVGPGNPTTYVRANTSHHLACVLDRLATLGVP